MSLKTISVPRAYDLEYSDASRTEHKITVDAVARLMLQRASLADLQGVRVH